MTNTVNSCIPNNNYEEKNKERVSVLVTVYDGELSTINIKVENNDSKRANNESNSLNI